jgi:predicted GIY-YIG superfamily endonuclease
MTDMAEYFTYKILKPTGDVAYVGYTKEPWKRELSHLYYRNAKYRDTDYTFNIVGKYTNDYEARYHEERLKRELGMKGEMGDERFQYYQKKFG